jgi:hypothetical protein
MHMNGFLRKITSLAAVGNLVVVLAIFAAVAAAASNPGSEHNASSGHSGDGNSGRRDTLNKDKPKPEPGDKTGDRGNSEDHRRDGTGTLPNPGRPKQGKTLNVDPGKGTVKVKLPGASRFVPLSAVASVPVGSVLDTRHGEVTLNTVPREDGVKQWASFSGAIFQVLQRGTGMPVTDIRLRGGSFANCGRPVARRSMIGRVLASSSRSRKVRSLWGHGKGHFRTRGRNGAATVRGTWWLTEDRCDGTLVRVRRGLVGVRDFKKHKTVAVPHGHSYLARR